MSLPSFFTPAQIRAYQKVRRGFEIRHPMTGNRICFVYDPQKKVRSTKIGIKTLEALLDAKLLKLKSREYPFEVYVLK
jgi:hypothetical protein